MLVFFSKGLLLGLAIAAPLGPIGVLCIQRSLHEGFKTGLATGLGAAFADGVYGLIAGFSLTTISNFLISQQHWIRLVGALFLFYLGLKIFFAPPHYQAGKVRYEKSLWHAFTTTFFLTLTNPMTIISFIAILAGLGLASSKTNYEHAIALVTGITFGSTLWWLFLSLFVAKILHHRINAKMIHAINYVSGIIMIAFGIFAIIQK